jgi:hypothetical protein
MEMGSAVTSRSRLGPPVTSVARRRGRRSMGRKCLDERMDGVDRMMRMMSTSKRRVEARSTTATTVRAMSGCEASTSSTSSSTSRTRRGDRTRARGAVREVMECATAAARASTDVGALSAEALRGAVFDEHSAWWKLASPLFAFSVAPYLLFLKRMNEAESASEEMRQAFATLLLFVLISIPAEAYTKSAYGEVLSNIDALHFLIQSAISLTNLRILLAFRDQRAGESNGVDAENGTTTFAAPFVGRPGRVVEAFAGVGLLATSLLLSLDERLLTVPATAPVPISSFVDHFRMWADDFELSTSALLGLPRPAANALSVPTWGVHIFSLVEWLLAMGLVWNYAERDKGDDKGWRTLTWGMLPLHASGICACTQHFFGNPASLDWLVAAQGAFTMMGNVGMCVAAGELAQNSARETPVTELASRSAVDSTNKGVVLDESESSWWDFDVENFGTKLWAEDNDGVFITKVALLSLAVAAGVRGLSLYLSPQFDPVDGPWRDYTNIIAFSMVSTPLVLNIEKWRRREQLVITRAALAAVYSSAIDVQDGEKEEIEC